MKVLIASAFMIGVLHSLAPEHWLPFVLLGRAQKWSASRLTAITGLAGLGHVSASLLIGAIGVFLGLATNQLKFLELNRGNIASFLLIGLGLAYVIWGIKNWGRKDSHLLPVRMVSSSLIFAFIALGACEPFVLLVFVGYGYGWTPVFLMFLVFGATVTGMMLLQVNLVYFGVSMFRSRWIEQYSTVLAGSIIALMGLFIRILGI
jgi:hypothetical protein